MSHYSFVKKIFEIDYPWAKSTGRFANFISPWRSKTRFSNL